VVLVATLTPSGDAPQPISLCLLCGDRGTADVLRNVILFAPLGAAIALCGWRGRWTVLAPAVLSLTVETAQIWIPGRDPSLGDVVFNTVGAVVGLAVVHSSVYWLRPPRRLRLALALFAALGAVGVLAATGMLLEMDLPYSTYWGQWTPDLGYLQWYRGQVLQASLGPRDLPGGGPLAHSTEVRALLLARTPLMVRALAGPRLPALGPLFSIYDDQRREIVLVGPDRDDLVLRYRTRALVARLEQPDVRAAGALRGITPGDPLQVVVRGDGRGYCIVVNQRSACGLGFTVGRGWALLSYPEKLPIWFRGLLDDVWIACLLVPVGFWMNGRKTGLLVIVIVGAGLTFVPAVTGLIPTPPGEIVGAAVGLGLGLALGSRVAAPPWRG
jgi:hypothetical protein